MKRLVVVLPIAASLAGCAASLYRPDGGRYFTGADLASGQVTIQMLLPTDVRCQDLRRRMVIAFMMTKKASEVEAAQANTCQKMPTTQSLPVSMVAQMKKAGEVIISRYVSLELCEADMASYQNIPEPKRLLTVVQDCAVR